MSDNDYPPLSAKNATLPTISRNGGLPHPLDTEWHVSIDETVYGPFSGHDMKTMAAEGRLEFDTLVQKVGEPDKWMQAAEDRTLSKFFTPDPKPHSRKASAFSAGDGAQVVTVSNNVGAQPAYWGTAGRQITFPGSDIVAVHRRRRTDVQRRSRKRHSDVHRLHLALGAFVGLDY